MKYLILIFIPFLLIAQPIQNKHKSVISRMNVVGGEPPAGETGDIFADDFETGDFSQWTGNYANSPNTKYIQSDTVGTQGDTYAATFLYRGQAGNFNYLSIPVPAVHDTILFRAYVRYSGYPNYPYDHFFPDSSGGSAWNDIVTMSDGGSSVAGIKVRSGSSTYEHGVPYYPMIRWIAYSVTQSGQSGDWASGLIDTSMTRAWQRLEFQYIKGTATQGTGAITVRVNGTQVATYTTINDSALVIDSLHIGNRFENNQPIGRWDWDDIVVDTTATGGWIGAKP